MIRCAEIKYWKEQFAEGDSSKKFSKVIRKAQGKDRKRQIPPIDDGSDNILVDDHAKAESINNYFSNIGRQLVEGFDTQTEESYENVYRISPSFSQIELTEKQLIDKLQHVKKKTGSTDNISSRELSKAGENLSEGLYSICKNSIKESVRPGNWKIGMVIPAFKKGIKSDRANYRSLTVLNLNSKILESVVCNSLDKHLTGNEVLHKNQWGFKEGISTELLLYTLAKHGRKPWTLAIK